ncbi:hypothetical protein [Amycolatopsis sp. FDAARGOS 1241]|uniref:hypothetical protein n=1 Tax=Amycolatopsis sp. FDAARGOS 1241 TaxID=2778070 RepID=UPI00194F1EED|nr:hypothetical protein [Amycolatopsis sp. FDAARGOS 1241]QRP49080.1 hypothetical protein I6J71_15550 [Amycolatopsis sp. FDAARGOS 1241]
MEARDHGLLRVRQAGLEFDFGETAAEAMAVYLLPPEIQCRDDQHEVRLEDQDRLRASMVKLGQATARLRCGSAGSCSSTTAARSAACGHR